MLTERYDELTQQQRRAARRAKLLRRLRGGDVWWLLTAMAGAIVIAAPPDEALWVRIAALGVLLTYVGRLERAFNALGELIRMSDEVEMRGDNPPSRMTEKPGLGSEQKIRHDQAMGPQAE